MTRRRARDADDALEARLGRPPAVAPGGLWDLAPAQRPPPPVAPDDVAAQLDAALERWAAGLGPRPQLPPGHVVRVVLPELEAPDTRDT